MSSLAKGDQVDSGLLGKVHSTHAKYFKPWPSARVVVVVFVGSFFGALCFVTVVPAVVTYLPKLLVQTVERSRERSA